MQRHKKLSARILSMALSVAMVATMMPATVFAAEGDVPLGASSLGTSSLGTIQSFEKLEDRFEPSTGEGASKDVYALNVELNTPVEDLNLPDELTAMVARTTTVSTPSDAEDVVDSGKPSEPAEDETIPDDTVSGNQPASPSDAKENEEIPDEDVPLAPKPDEETTVTTTEQEIISVRWNSDKEYKSDENGKFIYTAVLPEGYILADGVKLPQIYVAVGKQARAGSDTYTVGTNGKYKTLSAAMNDTYNVTQKTTLQLISDITESGINRDASIGIYIDLNGHTLKGDGTKPMFTGKFSAYIMNKGSTGGTLDINGQDLNVYDVPTRTGSDCYMSTSSAAASITIKNSGIGGTLSLPSIMINSGSYVILDQSVTLENPNYPGTTLGLNLNLTNSTLINNGTIKTESRGGIVGTVKNGATGKIYIGAGSVESIDNTTSGGKVYVTGGSIKSIAVTGNSGNVFYGESGTTPAVQYTFTLNNGTADLGNNIFVNALTTTPAYTYGMDGVKTRDTGKIYIWVPSGLTAASATVPSTAGASAGTYFNAAVSGTTATLTKGVEPAVTVTINGTSYAGSTLQDAISKLQGGATAVTSLKITAGKVTEADWNYLKSLTAMTTFEIDSGIETENVANIPNVQMGTSLFPKSITSVTVPQAITIGECAFFACLSLASADFPAATSIGSHAFAYCANLMTANFHAVTSIGVGAFVADYILTIESFPAATSIGIGAFRECTALSTVSFPKVTSIGDGAFASCTTLATLNLPAAPPTVGTDAFKDCPAARALGYVNAAGTALTDNDLTTAQAAYKAKDDGNTSDNLWYGWTIASATNAITLTINGATPAVGGATLQAALNGQTLTNVTSLKITAGKVTTADWEYLTNLSKMTTFEIDSAVTTVANIPDKTTSTDSIFPKSIVSVTVPQAITIGAQAFYGCAALTSASFPAATSMGNYAFRDCDKLTTASFPKVTTIGSNAFFFCFELTNASFPEATIISDRMFAGCSKLANASFPKATKIDIYAFLGCTALASASFPMMTDIGNNAFQDCTTLATLKLGAIPPTTVGTDAFKSCPATRALGYLKADGTALTGDALTTAQAAYKAFDDGDTTDGLWYGWTIVSATTHTITASASAGGSISPSGTVTVNNGESKTFTISANSNYSIASVTVDGVNQGTNSTFTFSNVTGNHTISATFSYNGSSGGGGSSSGQTIYTSVPPKYTGGTKNIGNVRVPDYTVEGAWKKNANGTWNFSGKEGQTYANSWAPVFNPYADVTKGQSAFDWFKFDTSGNMITGWHTDTDGNTYYLNPNSDNTLGAMKTGWVLIDGKYYYFNEMPDGTRGKLFQNTRTPDGYLVDQNGVWDGIKKQ